MQRKGSASYGSVPPAAALIDGWLLRRQHSRPGIHRDSFRFVLSTEAKHPGTEKTPLIGEEGGAAGPAAPGAAEFSSFLFWRNPLPSIEEDLLGLLVRASLPASLPPHPSTSLARRGFLDPVGWAGTVCPRSCPVALSFTESGLSPIGDGGLRKPGQRGGGGGGGGSSEWEGGRLDHAQ